MIRLVLTLSLLTASACSTISLDEVTRPVATAVERRTGQAITADAAGDDALGALLAQALTPEGAARIALVEHPRMRLAWAELGLARADLVEAGLLENPVLAASARFPEGGAGGTNLEFAISRTALDLLMRPARQRIAARELEAAQRRITHEMLEVANEARAHHYAAVAARARLALARETERAAQAGAELARRLREAGNMSALAADTHRLALGRAELERSALEEEAGILLAELTRALGLAPGQAIVLPDELSALPGTDPDRALLDELALSQRVDLAAARLAEQTAFEALDLAETWRWVPFVEVGIETERETEGGWLTGPHLAIALPLFDQGQAGIARLEALRDEATAQVSALELDVRSEVDLAVRRLAGARSRAERLETELRPLAARVLELAVREQSYMLRGTFELLEVREDGAELARQHVDALEGYWQARVALDGAVGTVLAVPEVPTQPHPAHEPSTTDPTMGTDREPSDHDAHHHHHAPMQDPTDRSSDRDHEEHR